jgi:hypothetical protein
MQKSIQLINIHATFPNPQISDHRRTEICNKTDISSILHVRPEIIECLIEDQALSPSFDLAPPPPPLHIFRQQVVSHSQSSCVSPGELTDGGAGAKSYAGEKALGLVLYQSFNTLCSRPLCSAMQPKLQVRQCTLDIFGIWRHRKVAQKQRQNYFIMNPFLLCWLWHSHSPAYGVSFLKTN